MKNKLLYLIFVFTIIALSGCKEYLEEDLFNDLGEGSFPTEDYVELLINDAYKDASFVSVDNNNNPDFLMSFAYRGMMYKFREPHFWRGVWDRWTWDASTFKVFDVMWNPSFAAIRAANDAIDVIPGVEMKDTKRKQEIIGEAKFLRALTYFNLVRLFGGIPIIDKGLTLQDDLYPSRASIEETYAFIVEDLKAAAEVLPTRSEAVTRHIGLGHATKGSALGLLGKVYATMAGAPLKDVSKLSLAKEALEQVINSNEYELLPEYKDVFDWKDDNNKEMLFTWNVAGVEQATKLRFFYARASKNAVLGIWFPANTTAKWYGNSYSPVEPEFAIWYAKHDTLERYKWNLVLDYEDKKTHEIRHFTDGPKNAAYGGKFRITDETELMDKSKWPLNFPVLRYADVLLLHSEVLNELNDPDVYNSINKVRDRAGLPAYIGLNQEQLRDSIYQERELELCFEHQLFFDLRRRGYEFAKNLMENYYNPDQNNYPAGFSISVEPYKMLYPIPASALENNYGLQQNPGY